MTDEFNIKNNKNKLMIYFATSYAFLCAILYLHSFWSTFNVNFFEYINFVDILVLTVYPIMGGIFAFLIGTLFSILLPKEKLNSNLVSGKKAYSKKIMNLYISSMVIIIAASIMAMLVSDYLLYFVPSYWVAFYLTRKITKLPFVDKILPNKDIVWQLTLIFFLIPLMSYSTGKINSKRILDGYNIQYAKSINLKNDNIIYEKAKIKYIGKGGNHFFFISEDNAIIYIINSEEMTQLELIKSKSKLEEPWEKLKKWFYKTNILNFNKN